MTMLHTYPTPVAPRHEERPTMTSTHVNNCTRKLTGSNEVHGLIEWTTYHIVAVCVVAFLFIVTVFGSALVIISIMKFKRLQIPSNYILLNMAVADICVAMIMPLILMIELLGEFSRNIYVCMLPYCLVTLASGVSLLTLCIIAYDRYAALVKPLRYGERITNVRIALICTAAWIYVLLISSVPFLGWYYSTGSELDFNCRYRVLNNYAILFQIVSIFLPGCVVMIYCYCRVMLVARRHTRAITAVQVSLFPSQLSMNKSYSMFKGNKYTRTLALILGIFIMTWVVFVVSLLIEIFCPICGCTIELHKYTGLLVFLNSSLNAWIYCYRNKDFKAAFRRLLRTVFPCLRKKLARSQSQLNEGRRGSTSRISEALSRTNSMVGGINQQLQVLYENDVLEEVAALPQQTQPVTQPSNNNSKLIPQEPVVVPTSQ